jgi:hypothetical protein
MKFWLMILLLILSKMLEGQCDLEVLEFDVIDGTVTVAFNNTENCGGTGGPDGISEIQFGFQAIDEDCNAMNVGWDFPWGFQLPGDNNHPGWVYSATTTESMTNWTNDYTDDIDPPYYTGDTITFPLDNVYQETSGSLFFNLFDILQYWNEEGYSIQAVIWQISYGPTMYSDAGGWAEVGPNGDGTTTGVGIYDDENWQDNWVIVGPCGDPIPEVVYDTVYVEIPPDTIYVLDFDTVFVYDTITEILPVVTFIYDTTYIELPPDTLYLTLTDTVVVNDTIPVAVNWYFYDTTYVYITDTIINTVTEYVTLPADTVYTYQYDIIEVDCATGQYCSTPFEECSVYIPNSFTPDNDGVNDAWGAVTDPDCWLDWRLVVVSRSGEVVWESFDPEEVWLGGDEYYIPNDVYVYRVECSGYGESYIINGHVTIIR